MVAAKVRLGDILVEQGLLNADQLQWCLQEQKRSGRKLGQIVVDQGFVAGDDICMALSRQFRIPYINLKTFNIDPSGVRMLPEIRARRFRAMVLEDRGDSLLVGLADPTDIYVYDELHRMLGKRLELAVVSETLLFEAMRCAKRSTPCSAPCRRRAAVPTTIPSWPRCCNATTSTGPPRSTMQLRCAVRPTMASGGWAWAFPTRPCRWRRKHSRPIAARRRAARSALSWRHSSKHAWGSCSVPD
jgi:hypothetical protein